METEKQDQTLKCDHCGKSFATREELRRHESTCKK
jgi:Zinc finger, C2H2 type